MTEEYLRQLKLDAESGNLTDMLALIAEIERLRDENRRFQSVSDGCAKCGIYLPPSTIGALCADCENDTANP